MSQLYASKHKSGKLFSACNPNRIEVTADISGPSKTRQEFTDECDVNAIMARYDAAGVWPFKDNAVPPVYLDFVGMPDLQDAMASLINAEEAFMTLPAIVRKEFDNDPVRFVEYASDTSKPEVLSQLRAWGLAEPEKAPAKPIEVRVIPEPAAPPIVPAKT
uniref:Capsid protein VP3 n=1 Tax=Gokushovirinae environmental samples TaxID=1478972 RepID=A0A2R3UAC8_9VIRU|nr:capsid protein VP3 [Gokushovirinae environmental samples]